MLFVIQNKIIFSDISRTNSTDNITFESTQKSNDRMEKNLIKNHHDCQLFTKHENIESIINKKSGLRWRDVDCLISVGREFHSFGATAEYVRPAILEDLVRGCEKEFGRRPDKAACICLLSYSLIGWIDITIQKIAQAKMATQHHTINQTTKSISQDNP